MEGVIDIKEHIESRTQPVFYKADPPLDFSDKRLSWGTMLELIKSKERQKQFWNFVEDLRQVRITFNQLLMAKFRPLPTRFKKNLQI